MGDTPRATVFLDPDRDPREGGPRLGDEKTTLKEFLRFQRLTLEIKCEGLDAKQLARRSVKPSTMSLLGLVRHMADVERSWFRRGLSGLDAPPLYRTDDDRDADWNGAVADDDVVADAWRNWGDEVTFSEQYVASADMATVVDTESHGPLAVRDVVVHMIEEYARHAGHADLLRERIDGRTGQ